MKLSLAPLQGMTNAFQRNIYNEIFPGMDVYYAPFIATSHMRKSRSPVFKDIVPENNSVPSLVPQLLGNNPEDFIHFSKVIGDLGYDEVNWNIGCPFPMLTRKKKGSGILPYPDLVDAFLDKVCKESPIELSVKIRLGLESVDEGPSLIDTLNQFPLKEVIIHGRTGIQKYEGRVDLEGFETLYNLSKHPVVYNGDIFTKADFHRVNDTFPLIESYMIGRGALRNPFIAGEIKGLSYSPIQKKSLFKDYHQAIYDYYKARIEDPHILLSKMKEFWVYGAWMIDQEEIFLHQIRQIKSRQDYDRLCFNTLEK